MKRLILVAMLVAGCGGTEGPSVTDFSIALSDGRSGALHTVVGGNNPAENASGILTIAPDAMDFTLGRLGDVDGLITVNTHDGLHYFVLVFNVNSDGSLSGFMCTHAHGESIPPRIAECPTFLATH